MRRNVRFWSRYTWENMEVMLIAMGIVLAIPLLNANQLVLMDFLYVMPYYLFLCAGFGTFLVNQGSQVLYIPLLLSMGETRRNAFWGFQCCRAAVIAVTLALGAAIWGVLPNVSGRELSSIPTFAVLLMIASSVGSLTGTLFIKIRWLGTFIIIGICGFLGGCIGGFIFSSSDNLLKIAKIGTVFETLPWELALTAAVMLAVDLGFHWSVLQKQEVRL